MLAGALLMLGSLVGDAAWLKLEDCPSLDRSRVVELAMLELQDPPTAVHVDVSCAGQDQFHIVLRHDDGRMMERDAPMVDDASERYLAVELVELLASSGTRARQLVPIPASVPVPASASAPAPAVESPPERPPLPVLWIDGTARFEAAAAPLTPLGGLGIGLTARVWRGASFRAEALAGVGARSLNSDDRIGVANAGGSGVMAWVFASRKAAYVLGLGARVQGVWLRGRTEAQERAGETHVGLSWSPQLSVGVLAPRRRRFATAWLHAGWTPRAVRGQSGGETVFSWSGPWFGVGVGLGQTLKP